MKGPYGTGDSGRDRTSSSIACFSCFSIWPNCRPCLICIRCGHTNRSTWPIFAAEITSGTRKYPSNKQLRTWLKTVWGGDRRPIRLLTHLRYFGHCFNPASFYYCYDQPIPRLWPSSWKSTIHPGESTFAMYWAPSKMNIPLNSGVAIS